jgi:hypothetical protein
MQTRGQGDWKESVTYGDDCLLDTRLVGPADEETNLRTFCGQ